MTKRIFVLIAEAIRAAKYSDDAIEHAGSTSLKSYRRGGNHALADLALRLANEFEAENPRFDRDRFLAACGGKTNA